MEDKRGKPRHQDRISDPPRAATDDTRFRTEGGNARRQGIPRKTRTINRLNMLTESLSIDRTMASTGRRRAPSGFIGGMIKSHGDYIPPRMGEELLFTCRH